MGCVPFGVPLSDSKEAKEATMERLFLGVRMETEVPLDLS